MVLPTQPAPAPPAPSQRQSCDRCHKQKLRCTRESNGNGGVCDRCLRKRSQCVYSFSLPKGRRSLYRLPDESTSSHTGGTKYHPASPTTEGVNPPALSSDIEDDGSARTNVDTAVHVAARSISEHAVLPEHVDPSMDMTGGQWPLLETLNWDDIELDVDWSSHNSSDVDAILSSLDTLTADGSAREVLDRTSPTQHSSPHHLHTNFQVHQPRGDIFQNDDGSNGSNTNRSDAPSGSSAIVNLPQEKYINPSFAISQLSQLSMRLSSLRSSSYTLAQATESTSSNLANAQQMPLIDAASFVSVATWLAHGHGSTSLNAQPSIQVPVESKSPYPSPTPETKPRGGHGILHDVFSSSHHLLEILYHLQVNHVNEQFNTSAITLASPALTAASSQSNSYFGQTNDTASKGIQQHHHHTMQIIRHLVIACEALLLEIYMAVLITLQHDAYPGGLMSTKALGDVRLVLVVQLCAYLIERQHDAVNSCLAPRSPSGQPSVNKSFPYNLELSNSHQSVPTGHVSDVADKEMLSDLKNQVRQRLTHLRQTLRCT